jgi:8-oxo-dGTP pyrophosphatase MutT (NUDIX family)
MEREEDRRGMVSESSSDTASRPQTGLDSCRIGDLESGIWDLESGIGNLAFDIPDHGWTTLSSRPIYENPWIAVREDQVLRPDGQPGIYGVVHFRNRAVGVLPVEADGSIWLVGQYRYPLGCFSWEIPEGGCPQGEEPHETARRELREETGLTAGKLELIGRSHLSNSVSDEWALVYRASELMPGPAAPEGCERLEVRRLSWEAVWQMLETGVITDSMSVIALLHEALRRKR